MASWTARPACFKLRLMLPDKGGMSLCSSIAQMKLEKAEEERDRFQREAAQLKARLNMGIRGMRMRAL